MTRDESLQIVGMILNTWHANKEWTKDEIDIYARLIQDMDAELTTSAVIRAAKELQYRPSIAELREFVRAERKRLAPQVAPREEPRGEPVPMWVRRWVCARILYERFDKPRDDRRFVEQGNYGDLTQELMPEGAWVEEANSLPDEAFMQGFRQMLKGAQARTVEA